MTTLHSGAILLLCCPDRAGLVSRISQSIYERGGNILDLDEHVDTVGKMFFIRVSWNAECGSVAPEKLEEAFAPLAESFGASWKIRLGTYRSL